MSPANLVGRYLFMGTAAFGSFAFIIAAAGGWLPWV